MNRTLAKWEVGVGAITAFCATAIAVEASKIPTLFIDPLGGRAVPFWTASVVIFLALLMTVRGYQRLRASASEGESHKRRPSKARGRVGGMLVLTLAYAVALHWKANFETATATFLVLAIGHLSGWERRATGIGLCIALFVAFGLHHLMTEVLVVDLP